MAEPLRTPRAQRLAGTLGPGRLQGQGALPGFRERPLARGSAGRAQTERPRNPGRKGSAVSPKSWLCHVEPSAAGTRWWREGVCVRLATSSRLEPRQLNAASGGGRPGAWAGRWREPRSAPAARSGLSARARAQRLGADSESKHAAAWKAPHVQAPRARLRRFPAMNWASESQPPARPAAERGASGRGMGTRRGPRGRLGFGPPAPALLATLGCSRSPLAPFPSRCLAQRPAPPLPATRGRAPPGALSPGRGHGPRRSGPPEGSQWPTLFPPPAPSEPGPRGPGRPSLCAPQPRPVPAAVPASERPPGRERGAPGAPSESRAG